MPADELDIQDPIDINRGLSLHYGDSDVYCKKLAEFGKVTLTSFMRALAQRVDFKDWDKVIILARHLQRLSDRICAGRLHLLCYSI